MTPNELADDGWRSVNLELNAYTAEHFEKKGWDAESIAEFLDEEVHDYRLIELSDSSDYDYALEKEERIDGSD